MEKNHLHPEDIKNYKPSTQLPDCMKNNTVKLYCQILIVITRKIYKIGRM